MQRKAILDTGPLVALLVKRDRFHPWAVTQWSQIEPPLLTCEAVLSEAFFLMHRYPVAQAAMLELLKEGAISVSFNLGDEIERVGELLTQYYSVPMSLADACLVRMAELMPGSQVLTLDSDFFIYRIHHDQAIGVIAPSELLG